ncbi:MAG: hypothetical protein HYU51_11385 [Candidatus Rokubacteria bacterium]|nr:hypothetical protein [Candidatus Rokubacteria bacterium]
MTYTNGIVALVLGLTLAGAHVAGATTAGAGDWRDLGPREPARGGCIGSPSPAADVEEGEPARVIGEVIALDPRSGLAMLATERGMLALQGTPETLKQLVVGDMVVVELVDEDAGPPTPRDTACL